MEKEKRAGRVRFVVVEKNDSLLVAVFQGAAYFLGQVQLRFQPHRHGGEKRPDSGRRIGQIRLDQAVELQQRLVIKCHVIQPVCAQLPLLQAEFDRALWKMRIMLDAGESLLLGRGNNPAIDHQRRRTVVIVSRNA